MLIIVLQSDSGVGDRENLEAVEAGFGALRGV
jgi:hypothetical protein